MERATVRLLCGSLGRAGQHVLLPLERCSAQHVLLEGALRLLRPKADVQRPLVREQSGVLRHSTTARFRFRVYNNPKL